MSDVAKGTDGLYYMGNAPQPRCFGLLWESAKDPECGQCAFEQVCGPAFIKGPLADALIQVGAGPGREDKLASALGVAPEAIALALSGMSLKDIDPELDAASEEVEDELEPEPVQEPAPKKAAPKKVAKKKAKKVAPKKGKKRPPVRAGVSAPSAQASASTKQPSTESAKPASAAAGIPEPYGEHTWLPRWERERARSKKVAALRIGSTIEVTRRSPLTGDRTVYSAKIFKGHYLCLVDNSKHPTLYKMTEHLTGHSSTWSGPRFWKLT